MRLRLASAIVRSEATGWNMPWNRTGCPSSAPNGTTSSISKSIVSPTRTLWTSPASLTSSAPPSAPTPTPGSCRPVSWGEVEVPLQGPLFEWGWAVRIGYLSDADATATVHLGKAQQDIQVTKGLGEVYVSLVGAGDTVRITDIPPGVNFCVGDVQVGQPTPSS